MKNLLKMSDLSPAELTHILDVADQLKAQQKLGGTAPLLAGKTVALMFSKASTRTRTSFEVGVYQLGGLGNYMNTAELQAGRGEPLKDTARVLGRYYDCVVWRTYRQSDLEEFAELAGVPVINGLTDYAHPCQVLADLMTIRERRGSLAGRKLCFVGDGSSMANSLIVGGLLAGMQVTGLGIAFAKNDSRGLDIQLNAVLAQMRTDGTLEQILGKYLEHPSQYLEVDTIGA